MTHPVRKASMLHIIVLTLAMLLSSCRANDLSNACLPLKAPGIVVLLRDVHVMSWTRTDLLIDPANPSRVDPSLPAGTRLRVSKISQPRVFDSNNADIEVIGELEDGRTFLYRWGSGETIHRAPWESADTPELRTVPCANN
ncbi:MAG: hypothetical protein ABIR62_06540 [Dokdonella sp.]|uniref:hypothetical protein n=1 Tax=Dokdonella sp. TaxID=2291710 RepID=UPI003265E05D